MAAAVLLGVLGSWPTRTRWGVDYVYYSQDLPLFQKAIDFASRDFQTRRLLERIDGSGLSDSATARALFVWTRENVRDVPDGMPIVDDHVFNILVRGYGAPDQQAEAFALLTAYSDLPSSSGLIEVEGAGYLLTLVEISGEWHPFDVPNGLVFTTRDDELASLPLLLSDTTLVWKALAGSPDLDPRHYLAALRRVEAVGLTTERMDAQRLWRRPLIELRVRLGLGND